MWCICTCMSMLNCTFCLIIDLNISSLFSISSIVPLPILILSWPEIHQYNTFTDTPYKDLPDREQLGSGALVPMGKAQIHWEPGVILPVPIAGLLYAVLLHRSAAILTGARVHLTLFWFLYRLPSCSMGVGPVNRSFITVLAAALVQTEHVFNTSECPSR